MNAYKKIENAAYAAVSRVSDSKPEVYLDGERAVCLFSIIVGGKMREHTQSNLVVKDGSNVVNCTVRFPRKENSGEKMDTVREVAERHIKGELGTHDRDNQIHLICPLTGTYDDYPVADFVEDVEAVIEELDESVYSH